MEALAVDVHMPLDELDHLPGEGDDRLDEVVLLATAHPLGPLEHHEVAPIHAVQVVAQLVHQKPGRRCPVWAPST